MPSKKINDLPTADVITSTDYVVAAKGGTDELLRATVGQVTDAAVRAISSPPLVRGGQDTFVILCILQSNSERDAPVSLTVPTGTPPFGGSPPDPFFVAVNNGTTTTYTYNGATTSGVLAWNNTTRTVGPATIGAPPFQNGFNSIGMGMAHRARVETGRDVLYIEVAEGGTPIERYLESSGATVTGAVAANPLRVSVSDVRWVAVGDRLTFSGVNGMTQLNSGEYTVSSCSVPYSVLRDATGPVPGEFTFNAVDASGWSAYVSGGRMNADHLWRLVVDQVPAALAAVGASRVHAVIGQGGEANGGPTPSDRVSTTGGTTSFQELLERHSELRARFRSQPWCPADVAFVFGELAHEDVNTGDKRRNDVLGVLAAYDPCVGVVSAEGQPTIDGTHLARRFNLGYHGYWRTYSGLVAGGSISPQWPVQLRDLTRPDGSLGWRPSTALSGDQSTINLNTFERGGRKWLTGAVITVRSSEIVLPDNILTSGWDYGLHFEVYQWSFSGVTPGRADGRTVIRGGAGATQTFIDLRTGATLIGNFVMEARVSMVRLMYIRANTWIVIGPPSVGFEAITSWTPTLRGSSGGDFSGSYTVRSGELQRNGRFITALFSIQISGSAPVGDLTIEGLPFTAALSTYRGSVTVSPRSTSSVAPDFFVRTAAGSTSLALFHNSTTGISTIVDTEVGANLTVQGSIVYVTNQGGVT